MGNSSDIIIIGGGLNGMCLSLALGQCGFSVTLADTQSIKTHANPQFDGRGYALALTSQRMLSALGLWQGIEANTQAILEINVSDGRAGEGAAPWFLHFDHAEIEEGPMGYMVEDRFLRAALLSAIAQETTVTHLDQSTVSGHAMEPGHADVVLADGRTLSAPLLVACDGQSSPTAERAGIRRTGWDYGQSSLVCAVSHRLPHNGIAQQFFMPPGPLAILPLPGNRSSIVWTEQSDEAARIQALSVDAYIDELRPRFGDYLGEISLAGDRFTYPLSLSLAQKIAAPRLALVGDAAHGIHPLAGQGLNLGLRDVAALTEVVVSASRRGEDIGAVDVLERYQRWRRFDIAGLAVATDGINRLFSNDNPIIRFARDAGLGLVNGMPDVRRGLIRHAAGLTGDVPRLMQGQKL